MAGAAKQLFPLFDRVLVQKAEAITRTRGGIIIPEKAKAKVVQGKVIAVGPGARNEEGDHIPPSLKVGDSVLLPEFGGTKVEIEEDKEYHMYRETDILAVLDK